MKVQKFLLIFGTVLGVFSPAEVSAQTFRISSGINADGQISYKEVYEFDYVDVKPEFPGGGTELLNFINDNRRYPAEAYATGIEGRVTCSFVVNTNGSVSDISVIRGVEKSLNKEAMRIISKMPDWTPGRIGDTPVPVRVICAVPFRK